MPKRPSRERLDRLPVRFGAFCEVAEVMVVRQMYDTIGCFGGAAQAVGIEAAEVHLGSGFRHRLRRRVGPSQPDDLMTCPDELATTAEPKNP
jgi:hypothetical protein